MPDVADAALCGLPHRDWPETVCTLPAGHDDGAPVVVHAGPLIIRGREGGGAAWTVPAGGAA